MSNEPLAQPANLQVPPNEQDYDTALAAAMATAHGRWFLAEYARRNRHPDTDLIVGAISRIEVTLRGEAPLWPDAGARSNLIEIAAAIERVAAAMSAGTDAKAIPALERLADIAFVLHERPVEPSLCDALDAAVREIAEACAAADSANGVGELLRALARRVNEMIAACAADGAGPAAAAAETDALIDSEVVRSALQFDEVEVASFARTVAILAAALPASDAPEPVLDGESDADAVGNSPEMAQVDAPVEAQVDAPVDAAVEVETAVDQDRDPEKTADDFSELLGAAEFVSTPHTPAAAADETSDAVEPVVAESAVEPVAAESAVEPGEAASQFQLEAPSFTVEPAPAVEPVADDAPAALQAKAQHPAEPEPAASEPLLPDNGGAAAAEESVAVHQFLPELQLESGAEDADNLAASPPEPPAMPMAEGVPVVEPVMELAPLTDALAADMSPMTEGESAPPQVSAPPPPAIPGPAPADPLAAVKALSAEELIALFT